MGLLYASWAVIFQYVNPTMQAIPPYVGQAVIRTGFDTVGPAIDIHNDDGQVFGYVHAANFENTVRRAVWLVEVQKEIPNEHRHWEHFDPMRRPTCWARLLKDDDD